MFAFKINSIIGHRGCNKFKFNNTLEAFLKAIELGADMIEFDIRKTKNGIFIIHHDADVFGHIIKDNSFADLKKIAHAKGLEIPTLEETFQKLKGKTAFNIELKEPSYETEVVRLALKYLSTSEFVIQSFHDEAVLKVKRSFPLVSAGLLLGTNDDLALDARIKRLKTLRRRVHELFPWKRVRNCRADFIAPNYQLLALGLLRAARRKKIPVFIWTVNDKKLMKRYWKTGLVHGFITDLPEMAKSLS